MRNQRAKENSGAKIINFADLEPTCRNCRWIGKDVCNRPGGWTMENGRCKEFERRKKTE